MVVVDQCPCEHVHDGALNPHLQHAVCPSSQSTLLANEDMSSVTNTPWNRKPIRPKPIDELVPSGSLTVIVA